MIDLPTPEERRVEARRLLKGMISAWVGREIGLSKSTVNKWKRGERIPDLDRLLRISQATNKPLSPDLQARLRGHGIELEDLPVKDRRRASG